MSLGQAVLIPGLGGGSGIAPDSGSLPDIDIWLAATEAEGASVPPSEGANVTKIVSKEGNAYEFTQGTAGNQGTYHATGFRSAYPCVRLDGVDDFYRLADSVSSRASMSVVLVFRTREGEAVDGQGIDSQNVISTADEGSNNYHLGFGYRYHDTIGKAGMMVTHNNLGGSVVADNNTDIFAGIDYVVGYTRTGSVTKIHVRGRDGTIQDITSTDGGEATSDTPNRDNWIIGCIKRSGGEIQHAYIDFVEAIVYSAALTDAQLSGVVANRLNNYGMSSGYATSGVPKMLYQGRKLESPAYMFTNTSTVAWYPRVVRNDAYTNSLTETFSIYYSSDHANPGPSNIGRCGFDYWMGTWTDDSTNNPVSTNAGEQEAPNIIVDTVNDELLLFPHGPGQRVHKLSSTDGISFTDEGTVFDFTWQHEGYGDFEAISGRIWQLGYNNGRDPGRFFALHTSDDWGDSFQWAKFLDDRKQWLGVGQNYMHYRSVFNWRGIKYIHTHYGFARWSWTERLLSDVFRWDVPWSGVDPSFSPSFGAVFVDDSGTDDMMYMVYQADYSTFEDGVNDDAAFFLCAPDMFESVTEKYTPLIATSGGKISYTSTADTAVADWDATAETLPSADFEIIETTGSSISSWSSGNYYQFECDAVNSDIRLRCKTGIDPTAHYIVDFIVEGITHEGNDSTHPLADAHWSFDLTDDNLDNGLITEWKSTSNSGAGRWRERSGGSDVGTHDELSFKWTDTPNRTHEMDIILRVFDYGTKVVWVYDGDEGPYTTLDNVSWGSGVKAKIRLENENTNPAKWMRFTRFAVYTGGALPTETLQVKVSGAFENLQVKVGGSFENLDVRI